MKLASMGTKRGRFLIRQTRVGKRDSDPSLQQQQQQPSPDTEFLDASPFSHRLLTVPHPKIERHASEPSPNMTQQSTMGSLSATPTHLLTVPQQMHHTTPFLVKQHSHPLLLPSQSSIDATTSSTLTHFTLQRQLSYPTTSDDTNILVSLASQPLISTSVASDNSSNIMTSISSQHFMDRPVKLEEQDAVGYSTVRSTRALSPTIVVVSEPLSMGSDILPTIRIKGEELQRSNSTPQPIRELSLENRSQHCPVIRPGPALGCNFCWNTIDAHGRILRRKTKYHCPECQTNLCIVPCFQEYHERQNNEQSSTASSSNENQSGSSTGKTSMPSLRQYPKTGSI